MTMPRKHGRVTSRGRDPSRAAKDDHNHHKHRDSDGGEQEIQAERTFLAAGFLALVAVEEATFLAAGFLAAVCSANEQRREGMSETSHELKQTRNGLVSLDLDDDDERNDDDIEEGKREDHREVGVRADKVETTAQHTRRALTNGNPS